MEKLSKQNDTSTLTSTRTRTRRQNNEKKNACSLQETTTVKLKSIDIAMKNPFPVEKEKQYHIKLLRVCFAVCNLCAIWSTTRSLLLH